MISFIRGAKINTWFDLGIYIDWIRENRATPAIEFSGSYHEFLAQELQHGLAFITFQFSVDGVSIEIEKYAKVFRELIDGVKIHYIAGKFYPDSKRNIHSDTYKFELREIQGFDKWKYYRDFYFTRLERGGARYNRLISDLWRDVLIITEKLAHYIYEHKINLLFMVNVCSNPGNISLALALVLISELMGIPVINNNHDFYWEGGNNPAEIESKGLKPGPRDFFFTNYHIGEIFSLIEILFPWESRSWINVNINCSQSKHLIEKKGHNPANVTEICTAVDTDKFVNISKRNKINAFFQFEKILSRYGKTLISYSVADVINNKLVDQKDPRPILIGLKTQPLVKFLTENIIFLQPTRVISRKKIELGFKLIRHLFGNSSFTDRFKHTPNLKVTILVTGPIASGHFDYFHKLISDFASLLKSLDVSLRERVFLAFLYSELDKENFKNRFKEPVGIPELYNISSLVLLPSRTEGRGLPIIEASACGTPILCRRYFPENVYSEVIGEQLPENERLKVLEFNGKKITAKHAFKVLERVLFPHKFTHEVLHNKMAVQKRFSLKALTKNIEDILLQTYHQVKRNENSMRITGEMVRKYLTLNNQEIPLLYTILKTDNRQYLAGYGKLKYMLNLKSLIDPSAFRNEEQQIKGYIFSYAQSLVKKGNTKLLKRIHIFYNAVANIFIYRKGKVKIRHDHSFAYRHRNENHYPYQEFTLQELTGLVNMLYIRLVGNHPSRRIDESSHFFTDWDLALGQMTSSIYIAIDDRKILINKMQSNVPVGIFPGDYVKYELEFFALQAIRSRLKLKIEDELTEDMILEHRDTLAKIYLFAQSVTIGRWFNVDEIKEYIEHGHENELFLLYKHGVLRIIETHQWCLGIHFCQIGENALKALNAIHEQDGFIISSRIDAAMMTDIVDLDKFHIGQAGDPVTASMMGIDKGAGYIQFVPAGIRTTLAYPTPVQTARDFHKTLHSESFRKFELKYGEKYLFDFIKKESEENGTPVNQILRMINDDKSEISPIDNGFINGLYEDGNPYSGAYAKVRMHKNNGKWIFRTISTMSRPMQVTEFVKNFEFTSGNSVNIAWNGGYILNNELVGKLGLPESYIGSPLGLLISEGILLCPPLFNKAAMLVGADSKVTIRKVNVRKGIIIRCKDTILKMSAEQYNLPSPPEGVPCYYDLLFPGNELVSKNRVIIRLAGNKIKEVIWPQNSNYVRIIPVGLTLSLPLDQVHDDLLKIEEEIIIEVSGLENIVHATGAGPLLVNNGRISINMKDEGWMSVNSINTQAARIDYTNMRGPKIAAGIDDQGNIIVLAINGRIRESVGATHHEMAEILIGMGVQSAMGFDPGGSSTLVANHEVLNISPYNPDYDKNIYALPPQPRAVSNAILGYFKHK